MPLCGIGHLEITLGVSTRWVVRDIHLKCANFISFSLCRQRYGMRERLVNRDVDEEGVDDTDYHVVYPHTLSPYAPTTTTAAPASTTTRS